MRLYLVQHGDALPKEMDPQRPLSDGGRADISRLAEFLQAPGLEVSRVIHSGKTRAQETAELLASAIASARPVETFQGLGPNDPPEEFAKQVPNWQEDTMVVGHLPFLARLVAHLVAGREIEVASFRPGTVVCLERSDPEGWQIVWMIRPELLRDRDS